MDRIALTIRKNEDEEEEKDEEEEEGDGRRRKRKRRKGRGKRIRRTWGTSRREEDEEENAPKGFQNTPEPAPWKPRVFNIMLSRTAFPPYKYTEFGPTPRYSKNVTLIRSSFFEFQGAG